MIATTPVTRHLDTLGIPYQTFRHPGPVASLEQAARERNQQAKQVIRSIVFRAGEGVFVLVLMAGAEQVGWRALRRYLRQSRLTMATEPELIQFTGYMAGAVSPFGLPAPMRILIDERVLQNDVVSIGSGERGLTVIITTADLRRALPDAEVGQYGDKPSTDQTDQTNDR
jgi:Cys-tRNA(Pro)/Cys-tRNA(Cys) deacylase